MSCRITVVVLNWNGWSDTVACVKSLQLLIAFDCHILVVDNGSTDESVMQIKAELPGVNVLQTGANLGFGGGCNVGIRHALNEGAEYVWLVNSDATVDSGALAALVRLADQNPSIGVVGSVLYEAGTADQIQLWGGGYINLWLGRSNHCAWARPVDFISGASMLLRRAALEDVGLFDDASFFMYWEDTDLCFRLRRAGWSLAVAEESHLWHKESASLGFGNPVLDSYATRSCVRFLRRYAPMPKLSVALMLIRMLTKRVLVGRPDRLRAVWQAYRTA